MEEDNTVDCAGGQVRHQDGGVGQLKEKMVRRIPSPLATAYLAATRDQQCLRNTLRHFSRAVLCPTRSAVVGLYTPENHVP